MTSGWKQPSSVWSGSSPQADKIVGQIESGLTEVYCKYKKGKRNGGYDNFLLNCNIGYIQHIADNALMASRLLQAF